MMSKLKIGFSRVNINPMMGIYVRGYFIDRYAEGILDDLEVNALALECNGTKVLLINVDNGGIVQGVLNDYRKMISEKVDIPMEHILISSSHTHTGPLVSNTSKSKLVKAYTEFLGKRITDAAGFAIADLKEAKVGYGKGVAPNVAFIRRYIMSDGTVKTNPGVNNPDIVSPASAVDESVNILRFDREDADTIVFVNFANHPDTIGGSKISADWPGLLRKKVEKVLDRTKCIFFNGAQGDVNHVNVHPKDGDMNGMFLDFDDVARGYAHADHIANVVTGGVLQIFSKVKYIEIDRIDAKLKKIDVPSNKAPIEELPEAHRINDLHIAGRDNELPYEGMTLTTVIAEAARKVRMENAPDTFDMLLSAVKIGPIAILGIPGEPFSKIGIQIKETEDFEFIIPCGMTNGHEGYFPMQDSYDEGGYEAKSSRFKAGVGEYIIKEAKELLSSLNK